MNRNRWPLWTGMGGRFHWNTHPTLLSCLGYDSELGLGRNLLDDEETLVSEIPLLDGAIKTWQPQLQKMWNFPEVCAEDEIFIDKNEHDVTINGRKFKYPLLIEFHQNGETTIKFEHGRFNTEKTLTEHFMEMVQGQTFLWVDNLSRVNDTSSTLPQKGYFVMYGQAGSDHLNVHVIDKRITIKLSDFYQQSAKVR